MKIWHISDTHNYHELLKIPKDIDIAILSGDISNDYNIFKNEPETLNTLYWYGNLDIKYKILISGNHDTYAFKNTTKFKEWCKYYNIIYLEDESITIEGINIYGSPWSPRFGDWHFMKARFKMERVWKYIPDNTDILVTHTPPKGILDLSEDYNRKLERCGCSALMKRILKLNLKYHLFGHIHNNKDIINAGIIKLSILDTIFSNGSIMTDGKFGKLSSNGNIINYK